MLEVCAQPSGHTDQTEEALLPWAQESSEVGQLRTQATAKM